MQVNIVITALDSNMKKINTTVSYANPEVSNDKLKELATALNNLTANTYSYTTKETKEEL